MNAHPEHAPPARIAKGRARTHPLERLATNPPRPVADATPPPAALRGVTPPPRVVQYKGKYIIKT